MKLLELEIHNVRGICDLLLKPDGANLVVWGANGSGKSAVVDAIDFLLTGRVTRLTGKGTAGLTLSKHGPHVDHKPIDAIVRAKIQIPGVPKPIEIRRCMATPNVFECDDKAALKQLDPIMMLAKRGQHVLTRREILKYITAESGTRAQEIQELLNVTEIEDVRKAFVTIQNNLEKELEKAKGAVTTAKGAVNATIQEKAFREDVVLGIINQNRSVLGGQPITRMHSSELKIGLIAPKVVAADGKPVNVTLFERDIQNLIGAISVQNSELIRKADEEMRALVASIHADPQMLDALARLHLTETGIALLDESGHCPLCDTVWPVGKLREYLEHRISTAHLASDIQMKISALSGTISNAVSATIASVQNVISVMKNAGLLDSLQLLQSWASDLKRLSTAVNSPIDKYPDPQFDTQQVSRMLAPTNVIKVLTGIQSAVKAKYPSATPEQTAWDTLTRLEENFKSLELANASLADAESAYRKAAILLSTVVWRKTAKT